MTIEDMKRKKKELGYSNKKLSELSGIPLGTIQKIFSGETSSPRYDTIQALTGVLSEQLREEKIFSAGGRTPQAVCEPEAAYQVNIKPGNSRSAGDKTIEDYIALPEGTRVELIDGRFYDMAAPTTIHQSIAVQIWQPLQNYIRMNNGKCIAFVAPTDVQLDFDNRTMLQPDVLVVCDRKKITKARVVGAPDFVAEVISPGNVFIDVMIKMLKYKNAGVKEYWIVFPDEKKVMVYEFEKSDLPKEYTFEDKVPVGIWNGECAVDFADIYSQIEFMYE